MRFSSKNRITFDSLKQRIQDGKVCLRAYGLKSKDSVKGYDYLCGIASIIDDEINDSVKSVELAKEEVANSRYSLGFQQGFDSANSPNEADEEYMLGWSDAKEVLEKSYNEFKFTEYHLDINEAIGR